MIHVVMQNYQADIALSDAAAAVGMSDSHFSRFRKKSTGDTFDELLNRTTISRACELLATTDRQITGICHDVSFDKVASFDSAIRQARGHEAARVSQRADGSRSPPTGRRS